MAVDIDLDLKDIERVVRQRHERRRSSVGLGCYLLCPCSLIPVFSQRWLELRSKVQTAKTKKPRWQNHASCDRCGLTIHLRGQGWRQGEPPAYGFTEAQVRKVAPLLETIKEAMRQEGQG